MKRVFKYSLQVVDFQALLLPMGAKLLCVQTQQARPCLWALVDESATLEKVRIRIAGTGHPIDETVCEYIDSFQLNNGALVFHVFRTAHD